MATIYDTRTMGQALNEAKPARSFLRRTFFANERTYNTEKVEVDSEDGVRVLAPFVNPNGPGKLIAREGFTTDTVTPPTVAPKRPITAVDLQSRLPGEHAYAESSPEERARMLLAKDLAALDGSIARREEWMCAKALFDSEVPIVGDGVNYTISFTRHADLSIGLLGAAARWDAGTGKPYDNVESWCDTVMKLSGVSPTVAVLGLSAWQAMRNNTSFKEMLDLLRMEAARVAPQAPVDGARYVGTLSGLGVELWVYSEWYADPTTGANEPMVPAKEILLGSPMMQTEMRYGAVPVASGESDNATIDLIPARRVPESWIAREPPVRWLKVSSRPVPVPIQNRFLTAQVIA